MSKLPKVEKQNLFREKFGIPTEQKIFLYQGILSEDRGLDYIISVNKCFQNKAAFVFMGDGDMKEYIVEKAKELPNFYHLDAVPMKDILKHTSSADIGLIDYSKSSLNVSHYLPNKFFEYAMAGIPQVVSSNLLTLSEMVKKFDIGWSVKNEEGLKAFISNFVKKTDSEMVDMGNNALRFAKQYNWEAQEETFVNVYKTLKF